MRRSIAAALALLACACGPVADNRSNSLAAFSLPEDYDPMTPLVVDLALEGDTCRASVGGERLNSERLAERALRTIENSVRFQEAARGSMEAVPLAIIRAAPDLPWRCTAAAIFELRWQGLYRLRLELRNEASVALELPPIGDPYSGPLPVRALVIGPDGSLQFNGARTSPERVVEALRAYAIERPRAVLAIMPAAQTRIDAVVALLVRAREAGAELTSSDRRGGGGLVGFDDAGRPAQMEQLEIYAGELK